MAANRKQRNGKNAIELAEEAFHLLRHAPASAWLAYLAGALPFALGLLFFWSEMSQSGFAWRYESAAALGLALLFVWLKCWQTVFCQMLLAHFTGQATAWTWRRALRLIVQQAAWQPTALFLVPLAAVMTVPFGWVFAFYQSYTVAGDGSQPEFKEHTRQAIACARSWAAQNHYFLALASVFGLFLFLNWISAFVLVPMLLKSFLGIETIFSRSASAYLNTTFFAAVIMLAWLCLDPIIKAAYTLRCFYTSARTSGEDLKASLRHLQPVPPLAAILLAGCLLGLPVAAAETAGAQPDSAVAPAQLDKAIGQVLDQREYTWRIPKEDVPKPETGESSNLLADTLDGMGKTLGNSLKGVGRGLEKVGQWWDGLFGGRKWPTPKTGTGDMQTDWLSPLRLLLLLLAAVILGVIGFFLYRIWKRWRRRTVITATPEAPAARPDLTSDYVAANELPEDEWLRLARDLMAQGDLRLALRALYLASLASLGERKLVTIAKFKSNRDYERELSRRAHALPGLAEAFHDHVLVFERVWYGLHEVSLDLLKDYETGVRQFRSPAP